MSPVISVIVSVYNEEKYLCRCVDSILNQTFQNLEVILVDDGSEDQSGAICDDYAKKDPRIRVIHQSNSGISDVRNVGVENAQGEYIGFVDGDDYIEPDMYEVLYRMITENNADISVCSIFNCFESGEKNQCEGGDFFICSGKEALEITLIGKKMPASLCNKLYRCEVIGNSRFPSGKTYEDAFFLPELFLRASIVVVTTDAYYNYWHRSGSITSSSFSEKAMDMIDAYQFTYDLIKFHCPELLPVAEFRLYRAYFIVLERILGTQNYKDRKEFGAVVSVLKQNWVKICRNNYFGKCRKFSVLILKFNVRLYRYLIFLRLKKKQFFDSK